MISKSKIFVICVLTCISYLLHAQDIHFSQFYSYPLFTNVANTGNFDGDFRFSLNNKNQWNSFTNAYRTFAASFDAGFDDLLLNSSRAGVGFHINNDIAGDGKFGSTQINLNSAYYYPISEKIKLGLGTNISYSFHYINTYNLKYGSQYVDESYNENYDSGESFYFENMSYPDFGIGTNIIYKLKPKMTFECGLMVSHLLNPQKSFAANSESFLPIKWSVIAMGEVNLKNDLWLEPHFISMFQQKYSEFNLGGIFRFDYNPLNLQALYFGGTVRASDAGILVFGFKYKNIKFLMNYDINLSKLATISKGKGGLEFSISYILSIIKPFKSPYYRKCPDFL